MAQSIENKTPLNAIHENNTFHFYEAYRELEKRLAYLTYIEFGLFVFDGDIRIFEKRPDDNGKLKPLAGCGQLNEVGIADTISGENTPLHITLSQFCYAKEDIDRLTPSYRYICFDDAYKEIAYFSNKPEEEIKQFLLQKAQDENIWPHHPYCGFANPEQESLWPDSAYPYDQITKILLDDFGISEYDFAFDIEVNIQELKVKGHSDDDVNRMRKILDRRLVSSAISIKRSNGVAEIASLRHGVDEYYKDADNLLDNPIPDMPNSPKHTDRVMRYVWLHELQAEYARVNKTIWCPERDERLKKIKECRDKINRQLRVIDDSINNSNEQINSNKIGSKNKKDTSDRKTKINEFLFNLWIEKSHPNAKSLVHAIKPLVGSNNCPVHKYHGWYDEVCVEWKPNTGSDKGSWGKKSFQNKAHEFKKTDAK